MTDEPVNEVEVTEEEKVEATPEKKSIKPKSKSASKTTRRKDTSDTWPVSKHVYYAEALYNRPAWLVKHVLKGHDDTEELTTEQVTKKLDKYLKTRI